MNFAEVSKNVYSRFIEIDGERFSWQSYIDLMYDKAVAKENFYTSLLSAMRLDNRYHLFKAPITYKETEVTIKVNGRKRLVRSTEVQEERRFYEIVEEHIVLKSTTGVNAGIGNGSSLGAASKRESVATLPEIFKSSENFNKCIHVLRELEIIGEEHNFIGKEKAALVLWIQEMLLRDIVIKCNDDEYARLLRGYFSNLEISGSLFRTEMKRAKEKYKNDFRMLLSKVKSM